MHFSLFVCITAKERASFEAAADKRLKPFDENKRGSSKHAFRWDWYQIGGRWTGLLDGYDPETDPKNVEQCDLCDGTGIRTDEIGFANGFPGMLLDPKVAKEVGRAHGYCNGCQAKGKRVVWPTSFKTREGDIQPASVALTCKKPPYALLDLDGEGLASETWTGKDWVKTKDWEKLWRAAVESAAKKNAFVVIVDCHT